MLVGHDRDLGPSPLKRLRQAQSSGTSSASSSESDPESPPPCRPRQTPFSRLPPEPESPPPRPARRGAFSPKPCSQSPPASPIPRPASPRHGPREAGPPRVSPRRTRQSQLQSLPVRHRRTQPYSDDDEPYEVAVSVILGPQGQGKHAGSKQRGGALAPLVPP